MKVLQFNICLYFVKRGQSRKNREKQRVLFDFSCALMYNINVVFLFMFDIFMSGSFCEQVMPANVII